VKFSIIAFTFVNKIYPDVFVFFAHKKYEIAVVKTFCESFHLYEIFKIRDLFKMIPIILSWKKTVIGVPDHDGGRPIEVNACILTTHMVYL
jgi:hypothetical protein